MKKPTQSSIILDYLKLRDEWVYGWELCKKETPLGWIGSDGMRVARHLEEDGKIIKEMKGKYVRYRLKPPMSEAEMHELFEPKSYTQSSIDEQTLIR